MDSDSAPLSPRVHSGSGMLEGRNLWWRMLLEQMSARKSFQQMQDELVDQRELSRALGAVDLIFLGVGGIIGTGIFVLAGVAAANNAGPSVILSFAISGFAAALAALCYTEISSMIPMSGSAYTFAYATLGEFVAWIIGWDLLLEYLIGAAAVSVGWSAYLVSLLKDAFSMEVDMRFCSSPLSWSEGSFRPTGGYVDLPAMSISIFMTVILVIGVRESASLNNCIVAFKLVVVLLVICIGFAHLHSENLSPFIPESSGQFGHYGVSGTFRASSIVFFAYIGFDSVTTMAQETREPQKNLPIGILGSLGICTVLYVLMSLVMVAVVPYTEYTGVANPISHLADKLNMRWLSILVSLAALCGLSTVILVTLMAQPRIFYSMAKDGLLPPQAALVHPRFKTPYVTTIISGVICSLASGFLPIDILADMTSIGTLFAFVLVSIGVIVLRYTQPDAPRVFRVPSIPLPYTRHQLHIFPLLSIVSCFALIACTTVETLYRFAVWMFIGFLLYFCYGAWHSKLGLHLNTLRVAQQKSVCSP